MVKRTTAGNFVIVSTSSALEHGMGHLCAASGSALHLRHREVFRHADFRFRQLRMRRDAAADETTYAQAESSELLWRTSRSSDFFDKRRCRSATSSVLFQRSRAADSISSGTAPSATCAATTLRILYSPQIGHRYLNTWGSTPLGVERFTRTAPGRPQRKHPAFGTADGAAAIRDKTSN